MRVAKILLDDDGLDRRLAGYYPSPNYIGEFMTGAMFKINPRGKMLDPSVGREELISHIQKDSGIQIDGIDIHTHNYSHSHCKFIQDDFINIYRKKKLA